MAAFTARAQTFAWPPSEGALTLSLWPAGAPGTESSKKAEVDATTEKDGLIGGRRVVRLSNVASPTITFYPARGKNTGAAVVVFPGGGYQVLAMDLEGTEVCDWLTNAGVNCVLLKYRVPDSGPYPKSSAALQDAQRAVGMVRARVEEWHIHPDRIGILGFSAGGHLAATLSNRWTKRMYSPVDSADSASCRPDFAVVVYPAYLTNEKQNFALDETLRPTEQTPPTFLVQTEDDPFRAENSIVYYRALQDAKVPAELHVYAQGGHGYGLRRTEAAVTGWPNLVEDWLRGLHVLDAPPQP